MPIIETRINARSEDFQANSAAMQAQIDDLEEASGNRGLAVRKVV